MTNSTISGNDAVNYAAGLFNDSNGVVNLSNVTLTGNSASNYGGVWNFGGNLNLQNTLIAGNTFRDCQGTVTSQGYNLIQMTLGCTITGTTIGNILGLDPSLGPLQDNGGPSLTHALLPGSPAIDEGNNATCESTDQRGIARPIGSACDIGAFESPLGIWRLFLALVLKNP